MLRHLLLVLALSAPAAAQIGDPLPGIPLGNLEVEIVDWVQMPNTQSSNPGKSDRRPASIARINFLREAPDGRIFINDLRGQIYTLDDDLQLQLYVDVDEPNNPIFPGIGYDGGLAAGLISFAFHPEFVANGVFYTIHMEFFATAAGPPDFTPVDADPNAPPAYHTVLTEWTATTPSASTWSGTRREVFRYGMTAKDYFHPHGDPAFNPNSEPNDADYGLLYLAGGDWAYVQDAPSQPEQLQRLDTLAGTCIRIDPRSPSVTGGPPGFGDYTIPLDNPFFEDGNNDQLDDDPSTFPEIWSFGHRNAHRQTWDSGGNHYIMEIGQAQIEEINILHAGQNYGWSDREGTFVNGTDINSGGNGNSEVVFALPGPPELDFRGQPYAYPVAQYDHGDGAAIAGGYAYEGQLVPQLRGKFVFGDIVRGRIFVSDTSALLAADDGDASTTASIEEVQLVAQGQATTLRDLVRAALGNNTGRADLRFGRDANGEIYVLTKEDGMIRRLIFRPALQWDCMDGPNNAVLASCALGDNDGDQDVDMNDVRLLQTQ